MKLGLTLWKLSTCSIAAAILALTPAMSSAQSCNQLTTKQLKAITSNNASLKLGGHGLNYSGVLNLYTNGSARGDVVMSNGKKFPISGTWHVANNQFCRTWVGGRNPHQRVCEIWCARSATSVWAYYAGHRQGINSW